MDVNVMFAGIMSLIHHATLNFGFCYLNHTTTINSFASNDPISLDVNSTHSIFHAVWRSVIGFKIRWACDIREIFKLYSSFFIRSVSRWSHFRRKILWLFIVNGWYGVGFFLITSLRRNIHSREWFIKRGFSLILVNPNYAYHLFLVVSR